MRDPKKEYQEPLAYSLMFAFGFVLVVVGGLLGLLEVRRIVSYGIMLLGVFVVLLSRLLNVLKMAREGYRKEIQEGRSALTVGIAAVAVIAAVIHGVPFSSAYGCGVLFGFLADFFFAYMDQRVDTGKFPVGKFVCMLICCALGSAACLLLAGRVKEWVILIVCAAFVGAMILLYMLTSDRKKDI